jgi:hypothetical protein
MDHQAGYEMNITGQPIQLGDGDRTTLPARFFKRGGKLRSPVDGIGPPLQRSHASPGVSI